MADDKAGWAGFAQVLPRTQGNLWPMIQMAQRQRENEQEIAFKQQQEARKSFDELSKSLYTAKLNPQLQKGQQDSLKRAYGAMNDVYRRINMGDYTGTREAINEIKQNHDMFAYGLESVQKQVDDIEKFAANTDNNKLLNREYVGSKLNSILNESLIKDEQGNVIGIDFEKSADLNGFFDDHRAWDDSAYINKMVDQLGESAYDYETDAWGSTLKESASNLFETERATVNGKEVLRVKRDPLTALPIIKTDTDTMAFFMKDNIFQQKLEDEAKRLTGDGDWRKKQPQAFKNLVQNFANFKEDKQTKQMPDRVRGKIEDQAIINTRDETINKILDNRDTSALAQTFGVSDRIKGEFTVGGRPVSEVANTGETVYPEEITIYRREVQYPNPYDPTQVKYSDWIPSEIIPIRTEEQKEVARYKLNSVMDDVAPNSGMKIGNDAYRQFRNNNKKSKEPIDLGIW